MTSEDGTFSPEQQTAAAFAESVAKEKEKLRAVVDALLTETDPAREKIYVERLQTLLLDTHYEMRARRAIIPADLKPDFIFGPDLLGDHAREVIENVFARATRQNPQPMPNNPRFPDWEEMTLKPRDVEFLFDRYGLGRETPLTFVQIAKAHNISPTNVRTVIAKAMYRMRQRPNRDPIHSLFKKEGTN